MFDDGITKVDPLQVVSIDAQKSPLSGVLSEGSRFGAYVIGSCIGHGGMARIYRAEHEGLRRQVALKVLIDGFARDPEGRERFLREARIAAAIKHPNVVNIFDVGVQDDIPFLVMELLEGEDLEAMVNRRGALTESMLVDIVVPIVAGLAAVHDAGVVHRDLKPGNIFLAKGRNEELEPKLLDFGISRAAESDDLKLTTARGLLMGTPLYMSPEAIQGGEINALSDQYSLGVVLYECSTGLNPFAADTLAETVRRVTTGDFAPPSQHNPTLSRRLARIIARAMSLDPEQRYADLREMGRELLLLAGQRTRITWSLSFGEIVTRRTGSLAVMSDSLVAAPSAHPARSTRKLVNAAAVALGVVMFAAAGALLWGKGRAETTGVLEQSLQPTATTPAATTTRPAPATRPMPTGSPNGAETAAAAAASSHPGQESAASKSDDDESATASEDGPSRASRSKAVDRSAASQPPKRRTASRAPSRARAATPRRAAPPPPAESSTPEWALDEEPKGRAAEALRRDTSKGTNNAPIFE